MSVGELEELIRTPAARRSLMVIYRRLMKGWRLFTPLPHARPFLECDTPYQIVTASNQSGKTSQVAYKIALILLGRDPMHKMPKENGVGIFVGQNADHLGDPMYGKLFLPGAFDIIRDRKTGLYRSVRPDPANPQLLDPEDLKRRDEWRPGPPLMPPSWIKSIAWENKAKRIPRFITGHNGWRLWFRSGEGKPPQGIQSHIHWLDEEIPNTAAWLNELAPRALRHGAVTIWSVTAQNATPQLFDLHYRAMQGDPNVKEFEFLLDANPYISPEAKRLFWDSLDPEQRAVRYLGQYAMAGRLIYPMFDMTKLHGCEPFEISANWCRYVVVDFGRRHCATLFAAVDPAEKHVWIYDGFDLQAGDATKWAERVYERQKGHRFDAIIADSRMGAETTVGNDKTVAEHYWEKLKARGIMPRREGPAHGFFPGSANTSAREEALLDALTIRSDGPHRGTCRLQIFRGAVPELERQIRNARTDDNGKRAKMVDDLLDGAEYLMAFDPGYFNPEPLNAPPTCPVWQNYMKKHKHRYNRLGHSGMVLG